MGVVYLAHDTRLEPPVALKFVRAECDRNRPTTLFLREARAASAPNHPDRLPIAAYQVSLRPSGYGGTAFAW
jgi:hypothetical protein